MLLTAVSLIIRKGCCCCTSIPKRYVICFLGFLSLMVMYIFRFCLSIVITEMVQAHPRNLTGKSHPGTCPYGEDDLVNSTTVVYRRKGEFTWDEETQGIVMSSAFWGYVLMTVPGGLITQRTGGKITLGIGVLVPTIATIITPIVARKGDVWGLVSLRVIMGLSQGFMFPSLNYLLARWAPFEERGRLGTLIFSGTVLGNIVNFIVSGLILSWTEGAWEVVFYVWGCVGVVWLLLWCLCGYDRPEDHPGLSPEERQYLEEYTSKIRMQEKPGPTPWKEMLSSLPLWALVIAQVGHDWGTFTISNELPKYMKNVIHVSIAETGLRSALPFVAMLVVAFLSGALVDLWLAKKITSVGAARKLFSVVAAFGPAIGIMGASYAECDKNTVTAFFILGMGLGGFYYPSYKVNCLDLSPNYAGTLMAIICGVGAMTGITTPYIVGLIITDNTIKQWRHAFLIASSALIVSNVFYLSTGSGQLQPWDDPASASAKERGPVKK